MKNEVLIQSSKTSVRVEVDGSGDDFDRARLESIYVRDFYLNNTNNKKKK